MRADRLVAVLLLLQQRGRVTAAEVAHELEVSERTARRDLEALGMAGIPVYSQQGRGGGWRLAGGGRTDLSGLNAEEARALFAVAGPQATPEVRAALRKLVRALPEPLRKQAETASASVVVDPEGWGRASGARPPPPLLDDLQRAIVAGVQVDLGYVDRQGRASTRRVHPLGVGAKGATWYLVAHTSAGQRLFRVDRATAVSATEEPLERPEGFDLRTAWSEIVEHVDAARAPVPARGTVDPSMVGLLRMVLGTRLAVGPASAADVGGRVAVELRGHSTYSLAAELAGFAAGLEITDPPEVREALAEIGASLVATYGAPAAT